MMVKLKDILNEFVDNEITFLERYLNSSEKDKVSEIIELIGEGNLIRYFIEHEEDIPYVIDTYYKGQEEELLNCDTFDELEELNPELHAEYNNILLRYVNDTRNLKELLTQFGWYSPEEYPSWIYLREAKVISNQWLVHSTNKNAIRSIFDDGFIKGVDDPTRLGLTTYYNSDSYEKSSGGYNFAHTIEDFQRYGIFRGGVKYGDNNNVVVFRASGLRCWHGTDGEYQVIFNGKTARDVVPIICEDEFWKIRTNFDGGKPLYSNRNIIKAVEWATKNYTQYRKAIGWKK